jgi:hypothetical protein
MHCTYYTRNLWNWTTGLLKSKYIHLLFVHKYSLVLFDSTHFKCWLHQDCFDCLSHDDGQKTVAESTGQSSIMSQYLRWVASSPLHCPHVSGQKSLSACIIINRNPFMSLSCNLFLLPDTSLIV